MQVDGPKIRELRENLGLTAKDLSNAASVSPSHLSLIERGYRNASPHVAARLAAALFVAITELRPDA
jgi:transcriptional regulator with XRE-family HTH domain